MYTSTTGRRVVSRDVLFLLIEYIDDLVTFVDYKSHSDDDPRNYQRPLGNRLVCAFVIHVALCGARIAQSEQLPVTAEMYLGMVEFTVRQDVKFNQPLFCNIASILTRFSRVN